MMLLKDTGRKDFTNDFGDVIEANDNFIFFSEGTYMGSVYSG
jgi:hypothetical protein